MLLYSLDLFGVTIFAITGSLAAQRKQMDLFGIIVIAFVTAVGGGTLRDVILGQFPVFWVADPIYVVFVLLGVILTALMIRLRLLPQRPLLLADAFGLALFTVIGTQSALDSDVHWGIAVIMGVMSAVAGGVVRDILSDDIPLILRKEIYATASFLGALIYIVCQMLTATWIAVFVSMMMTLTLRLIAIWRGWSLPSHLIGFRKD